MIRVDRGLEMIRMLAIIVAVTTLAGCGAGGGGVASTGGGGISGTGISVGSVTAFGSVFVNGTEFDTAGATIVVEGSGATQSDLRVGHVVVVDANFDDDKATRVEYRAQIKGPVTAIAVQDATVGRATLTVFGQTVTTNSATNFSGAGIDPAQPNALRVGDLVEISGLLDANGALVATFLEVKNSLGEYQVIGRVGNLTATTFSIGGLTINFASANANPRSGDTVEASGAASGFNAAASTFAADSVETLSRLTPANNETAEVEGYINRFVSTSDFYVGNVRGQVVAATRFEGGSAASLGPNVKVEMEGKVNSSGVLVADKIEIKDTGAVRLEGNVEQINSSAQQLVVLGVRFSLRADAELDDHSSANVDPLTFADIAVGDRVEVRAFIDGNSVIATEVRRDNADPSASLRGRVTAVNPGASQITILGVPVTGNAATNYQGASGQTAFFNAVRVGDFVAADWDVYSATSVPADELAIEAD